MLNLLKSKKLKHMLSKMMRLWRNLHRYSQGEEEKALELLLKNIRQKNAIEPVIVPEDKTEEVTVEKQPATKHVNGRLNSRS